MITYTYIYIIYTSTAALDYGKYPFAANPHHHQTFQEFGGRQKNVSQANTIKPTTTHLEVQPQDTGMQNMFQILKYRKKLLKASGHIQATTRHVCLESQLSLVGD